MAKNKAHPTIRCVDPLNLVQEKAYEGDIGLDLVAASDPLIVGHRLRDNDWKHIDYIEYDTGISACLDDISAKNSGIFLFPRSSISRHWLTLCNSVGVIDHGYRDTIKVRFKYIPQPSDYLVFEDWLILRPDIERMYKRGDKIAQLIFFNLIHPIKKNVEKLPVSDRGLKGFGSSGD
mgnify:CR=1 FL=1|jgi:dUTPase